MKEHALYRGIFGGIGIAALLLVGIYVLWRLTVPFDPLLRTTFAKTSGITSYAQYTDTSYEETPGEVLHIVGTYLVDRTHNDFASYSTTTLLVQGAPRVTFSLENLSIGNDVYVDLLNHSPSFKLAVPANGEWQHFTAGSIPHAYDGIAIAGPILDELTLLGDNGNYLSLIRNDGVEQMNGASLAHYTLRLSSAAETASDPTVSQMAGRIGPQGMIDLWIDQSDQLVSMMRLENNTYVSTTTFSLENQPLNIERPVTGS